MGKGTVEYRSELEDVLKVLKIFWIVFRKYDIRKPKNKDKIMMILLANLAKIRKSKLANHLVVMTFVKNRANIENLPKMSILR